MTELPTLGTRLSALISVCHRRAEPPIGLDDLAAAADAAGPAAVPVSLITALVADHGTVTPSEQQLEQIARQFPEAPDGFLSSQDPTWTDGVLAQMELLSAMRDARVTSIRSCRTPDPQDAEARRSLAAVIRDTDTGPTVGIEVRDDARRHAFTAPETHGGTPSAPRRWWRRWRRPHS